MEQVDVSIEGVKILTRQSPQDVTSFMRECAVGSEASTTTSELGTEREEELPARGWFR